MEPLLHIFYFLLHFAYIQLFPSEVLSNSPLCFLHSFLVSVVTPGFILSTEDLEVGTIDEKDQGTFVPLGLSYLSMIFFKFHPLMVNFMILLFSQLNSIS